MMSSQVAKAETNSKSVVPGRWKLVTRASTILNRYGGWMKRSEYATVAFSFPRESTADSSVRTVVVPSAIILPPFPFAVLIASTARFRISKYSEAII